MTARRQHYVWRKYLEPWTMKRGKAQQLWCLRRDRIAPFTVDTKNVAVERDFYRLLDLNDGDTDFVRALAVPAGIHTRVREVNEGWIAQFASYLSLQRSARAHPKASHALLAALDKEMIQFQEDAYSRLETNAVKHLEALRAGDVSFVQDDNQAMFFCFFLAHQYFRTKAIRDRIRITFKITSHRERFERTWPIFRYIFATNVGFSIFSNRNSAPFQIVRSAPGMEFITSDQPIINTYGAFATPETQVNEVELYYPVSPNCALLISNQSMYDGIHGKLIESGLVDRFNLAMALSAHEQLFGSSMTTLLDRAPDFSK